MQSPHTAHPGRTRSGTTYGIAYSLPPSFSLESALQDAVNAEVENEPDSEDERKLGKDRGTTKASTPITPLAEGDQPAPFQAVLMALDVAMGPHPKASVEGVNAEAPPSRKRKATTPDTDAPLRPSPRSEISTHRLQFPSANPPAPSAGGVRAPTPMDEGFSSDGGGGGSADEGVRPNLSRKEKRKKRKNDHRAKKRKMDRAEEIHHNTRRPRKKDVESRVVKDKAITTDVDICGLPADSSGYGATYADALDKEREVLNLGKLESEGYAVIEWDGREPLLFQESETKKLVVIAVGIPEDESYPAACESIHQLFLRLGEENEWEEGYLDHKRGKNWAALNMGTAYGFGNKPYNQANDGHENVVDELLSSPELRRIAIHQSESLRFYMPDLYDYYHKRTRSFREANTHLRVNWTGSVYSSAACNLGPQVATFMHRDCMNLPFGFCAIHAFGNYDHTKGGHLVLKELKLIIQFPPGALILIPSATLTHGNIPVREGETRTSFTQYTAGALFRFVDNGFRSEKQFKKRDAKGYRKMQEEKPKRWAMGLGLWSTIDDLLQRPDKPPVVVPL